jgi:hypothetical protein
MHKELHVIALYICKHKGVGFICMLSLQLPIEMFEV